jgi:DNA-binding PadR family transcriptional regulator
MRDVDITLKATRVLNVFLADPGQPRYGFELMQLTGLGSGTLYPILVRLEGAGWLARSKENADPSVIGRPRRTFYTLTAEALPVARARLAAISAEFGAHA